MCCYMRSTQIPLWIVAVVTVGSYLLIGNLFRLVTCGDLAHLYLLGAKPRSLVSANSKLESTRKFYNKSKKKKKDNLQTSIITTFLYT